MDVAKPRWWRSRRAGLLGLFILGLAALLLFFGSPDSDLRGTGALATGSAGETAGAGMMVRMLLSLALVLALIVAAGALLRRWTQTPRRSPATCQLEILASTPLAPKKQLVLARAVDRILVLGVTESSITKLASLPSSATQASAASSPAEPEFNLAGFLTTWKS